MDDLEMARHVRDAVDLVLSEFLRNAPDGMEDARFTIQAAFIIAGLQSLLAEYGPGKAAQTLNHGFQMTTGQDLVQTLYSGARQSKRLH